MLGVCRPTLVDNGVSMAGHLLRRRPPTAMPPPPRQLCTRFSSSSNPSSSSSPPPPPVAKMSDEAKSKVGQLFDTLASTASQTASKATDRVTQAAAEAAEATADKAKIAATKATNELRHSMRAAKINAKESGEQYAWEAHRSISRVGEGVKQSARVTAKKTGERVKESISHISQSAASRLKEEVAKRMPKLPSFSSKKLQSTASVRALPSRDALAKSAFVQSASAIAAETASQTASHVTTQVQEGVGKATRWLWWWGLAAVGVYGMSTTLTREGVQALRDMIGPKKGGGSDAAAPATTTDVATPVDTSSANDYAEKVDGGVGKGRGNWISSWFFRQGNLAGDGKDGHMK